MRATMSISESTVRLLFLSVITSDMVGRDTLSRLAGLAGVGLISGQIYQHAGATLL